MWKFCLNLNSSAFNAYRHICQSVALLSEDFKLSVMSYEQGEMIRVIFSCDEMYALEVKAHLTRIISRAVGQCYKENFLKSKLSFPIEDELFRFALLRAFINFDRETDYFLISHTLKLDKVLYLDSFVCFKLGTLTKKWEELVALANDNLQYFLDEEGFFELMRFLIDNMEVVESEVTVLEEQGGYRILDSSFKLIAGDQKKFDVLGILIDIAPKKINLFCKAKTSYVKFLERIFEEKINISTDRQDKLQTYNITEFK